MTEKNQTDDINWLALFDSKYLRSVDLDGPVLVQICRVWKEEMRLPNAKESEVRPVLLFELVSGKMHCDPKPLVLNKTNAGAIADVLGEARASRWSGKQVVLYPTTCRLGRETVNCIRVRKPKKEVRKDG